jgi:hypothetical protein
MHRALGSPLIPSGDCMTTYFLHTLNVLAYLRRNDTAYCLYSIVKGRTYSLRHKAYFKQPDEPFGTNVGYSVIPLTHDLKNETLAPFLGEIICRLSKP